MLHMNYIFFWIMNMDDTEADLKGVTNPTSSQ